MSSKPPINFGMHHGGYASGPFDELQRLRGNAFHGGNGDRSMERCTVMAVNPSTYTCTVYTESGQYLHGIPFPASGGIKAPETGSQRFAVHYQLGYPQLVDANHVVQAGETADSSYALAGVTDEVGTNSTVYANRGEGQHRGNRPSDVNPGDWFQMGEDGNLIAVLSGGAVVMKASELAQIIVTQAHNLVRLLGKNVRMDTGMGHLALETEEGKSTLELRLGADEATEGSPAMENFRIRAELGTEGEMVDFRVTDGKGRDQYRIHVDPDGRAEVTALSRVDVVEEYRTDITGGDHEAQVGGSVTTVVGESSTTTVAGSVSETCDGNRTQVVGTNYTCAAGRDVSVSAGRNIRMAATGGLGGAAGPAVEINAANGDFQINVGRVRDGDTQVGRSGFKVNTLTGNIEMSSRLGNIKLDTTLPNSVKLGGPGPGIFSAVLHEFFAQIIRVMNLLFDTHVHPIPSMGGVPTGPPLIPMTPLVAPFLPLSKSLFVNYGG